MVTTMILSLLPLLICKDEKMQEVVGTTEELPLINYMD
jgi:hypothetical protein